MQKSPILIWNRREKKEEVEAVYGDAFVRWLYGTSTGQFLVEHLFPKVRLSRLYGAFQASSFSAYKVESFVKRFKIHHEEFEGWPFRSFNDFFIREFKLGVRPFIQDPQQMPAFAEARYFAFDRVSEKQVFPIKGSALSAEALLGDVKKAKPFLGGAVLIARLCPTDYHRFHFPDSGRIIESYRVHGPLHSVNPMALAYKNEILSTNERQISILETQSFGRLAYIEIGALCVGKIVQLHPQDKEFSRGDVKGYFLFGGSTVVLLGEPGAWAPDSDLLEQTAQNRETLVRLGEKIALATHF